MTYMKHTELRHLDMDDLLILHRLSSGVAQNTIAKELCLTPPTIVHRLKKCAHVFGDIFIQGRGKRLNDEGLRVSKKCGEAISLFLGSGF